MLVGKICFDLARARFSYPEIGVLLSEVPSLAQARRAARKLARNGQTDTSIEKRAKAEVSAARRRASDRINRRIKRYNALLREPG